MAKIRFKCGCGKVLVVDEKHAGKVAKCPACQRLVRVPDVHNAPAPDDIVLPKTPEAAPSLRDVYGDALHAKSRRQRANAAIDDYNRRTRKRNVIIAASVVLVLLLSFISYKGIKRYGYAPPKDKCPESTWPFLDGLSRSDPRQRAAATWEVADAGGAEIAWVIQKMAEDDEPFVAVVAVRALGRIDKDGAERHLEPLLSAAGRDVRLAAAFVLAQLSVTGVTSSGQAQWIAKALAGDAKWAEWFDGLIQNGVARASIVEFLDKQRRSRRPRDRAMAAWMIAATVGPDQMILPLLRDPEAEVVVSAIRALAPFLSAEAFARLDDEEDPKEAVRRRSAMLNVVAQRLRHEDARVRRAAAAALAPNGQDFSARAFGRALEDDDWFVRFAVLKGLSALSPELAWQVVRAAGPDVGGGSVWVERVRKRIEAAARAKRPREEE